MPMKERWKFVCGILVLAVGVMAMCILASGAVHDYILGALGL